MPRPESHSRREILEERVYELILEFPERLDAMETRSESASRALARQIVELFEEESLRRRTQG